MRRNPLKSLLFQIGVRYGRLPRQSPLPLVERNVLELGCDEQFEKHLVLVAGVLDVVADHSRDEADIVRAEVPLSGPFPRRGTRSYDPSP